jgi:soluble lytic murein transglycosylase-like protein
MRSTRLIISTCAAIVLAFSITALAPATAGARPLATCADKLCTKDRPHSPSCYRYDRRQNEARCFIVRAARFYHQPQGLALSIAYRESRWNPGVTNRSSGAAGLYQFMPRTWRYTPYGKRGKSAYNPRWASLGAMWMWAHGYYSHWG